MFAALGRAVAHHPLRFIVGWLLILVIAGAGAFWGYGNGGLFDRLSSFESLVPGSESDKVTQATSSQTEGATITIVVGGLDMDTDVPGVMAFMAENRSTLADVDGVSSQSDPFLAGPPTTPQAQALMSDKLDGFVVFVTLDKDLNSDDQGAAEDRVNDAMDEFESDMREQFPDVTCDLLSNTASADAVIGQVQTDLVRGEAVGLPVALLLLIIVFGGLVAAGLPIIGAIVSIGIGMGALWAITFSINVESFILNVVSVIGLALSIDYGLLVVSRYREELTSVLAARGYPADGSRVPDKEECRQIVPEAVQATVKTAGRTVFFSALTIAMAMLALVVMKASMLRIIAAGGMIVTLLAVLMAITLVPSLIVVLNRVMVKPSVVTKIPVLRSVVKAVGDSSSDTGFFSRLAHWVHKHPWIIMIAVFAILGVMASPLKDLQARTVLTDYLPEGNSVTIAYDTVQDDYPALRAASIIVVADTSPEGTAELVDHVTQLDGVDYVSAPTALASDSSKSLINIHVDTDNQVGTQVTDYVKSLRDYDPGYETQIGGPAALQLDFLNSIIDGAPLALTIMILAVFILLFLMTGSLIVPLKALIINSLSLFASLGTTSFIFMNGFFGMPQVMGLETFILACSICFGFGLAMDYEVFLIARIKEYWDQGYGNDEAVERGLQRSGRIITSAAAIIVAVFIGFTTGDMLAIKEIGIALSVTVITDATLVRMLLVPATMTVLGKWNWWAPKPLRWVYSKLHITH